MPQPTRTNCGRDREFANVAGKREGCVRTTKLLAFSVTMLLLLGALGHAADSAISTHSTESAGTARVPGALQKRAPINDETSERIRAQSKGARPDPSTYLTKTYIEQHLAQFDGGCA